MEKEQRVDDILDIFNENGENTGESKTYTEVHQKGLLHLSVHIWIVNSKKQFLLQKRSENVACPLFWDNSAGGHVTHGQSSIKAAQLEIEEELGIYLTEDKIKYIFQGRENVAFDDGKHIENGFNDVYLVECDTPIEEFKFGKDEVKELRWIDIEELKEWFAGRGEKITPRSEECERLFKYLNEK